MSEYEEIEEVEEETEETGDVQFWSGICLECEAEWNGMDGQNVCPCCGSAECDLTEEDEEGDGIISRGTAN